MRKRNLVDLKSAVRGRVKKGVGGGGVKGKHVKVWVTVI
jgi:hypothetical protein